MTAISKTWVSIADAAVDPDSPIDTALITALRDNAIYVREWMGASFYAGAVQNHDHDGVNSAKVQVGSNMLRNGDFENGLVGWTQTPYTGGTIATYTGDADGTASVQITSTVLANGGGDILSDEFMVCIGGAAYDWSVTNWASVANVSSKLEAVFYDQAKAAISTSVLLTNTSTPTAKTRSNGSIATPSTARYMKIKCTGGIPATGSAVGTSYFDAVHCNLSASQALAGTGNLVTIETGHSLAINEYEIGSESSAAVSMSEYFNARINKDGTYRVAFSFLGSVQAYGQIYKNGVAYGTFRTNNTGAYVEYTEDLAFVAGDTVQIYLAPYTGSHSLYGKNFGFRVLNSVSNNLAAPSQLQIGLR